jgi:hypothetical protein
MREVIDLCKRGWLRLNVSTLRTRAPRLPRIGVLIPVLDECLQLRAQILATEGECAQDRTTGLIRAPPSESIQLVRESLTLDHETNRVLESLRRVWHVRRQKETLALSNGNVFEHTAGVIDDLEVHIALDHEEPFLAVIDVIIRALIRPADDHHLPLTVATVNHTVADRRGQLVTIRFDPGEEMIRRWMSRTVEHGEGGRGGGQLRPSTSMIGR